LLVLFFNDVTVKPPVPMPFIGKCSKQRCSNLQTTFYLPVRHLFDG